MKSILRYTQVAKCWEFAWLLEMQVLDIGTCRDVDCVDRSWLLAIFIMVSVIAF